MRYCLIGKQPQANGLYHKRILHRPGELHAMTKVPGELRFTLDVRAYSAEHLRELEMAIIRSIEERRGVRFELGNTARRSRRDGCINLRQVGNDRARAGNLGATTR